MTITYNEFEIDTPIKSIDYNDDYGYYISTNNVKDIINNYINAEEYDHIFVAYKLGENLHKEKIKTGDWIGLGGMTYEHDIGFSNIRVPNENSNLIYKYSLYNTFPEEVFVHEFLHGLERIEKEYGNDIIELHSNEKYGYEKDEKTGLQKWYEVYLQSKVTEEGLGLNKEVFKRKPVHESDFATSINITNEIFNEPENLKEELESIFVEIKKYFNNIKQNNNYVEE